MPPTLARINIARAPAFASVLRVRWIASKGAADVLPAVEEVKDKASKDPSVLSSEGAVGKHFNPDGAIGQVGEKIGGPFSSEGAIGSQFDASKDGVAGKVEETVDGPRKPTNEK